MLRYHPFAKLSGSSARKVAWRAAWLTPLIVGPLWIGLGSYVVPNGFATLSGCILAALLAASSYTDLRWTKIPNWATYTAAAWALGLNLLATLLTLSGGSEVPWFPLLLGTIGFEQSLLGCGICFAAMFLVYYLCRTGAGDVKLAAAIGALVGPEAGLQILVLCHLLAGVMIFWWLVWAVGPWAILSAFGRLLGHFCFPLWILPPTCEHRLVLQQPVPMAAFFAAATLLTSGGFAL